jgi:uncharacterized membrane protein
MGILNSGRRYIIQVRIRAIVERLRQSLFFLPALLVVAFVALAEGLLSLDGSTPSSSLPEYLHTTVDSARSVLSTIAGAIITVTGLVFSVGVVALQLASSQFSPRVLRTFLRSRFQQFVMGFMVGVFTYCLVVLRTIHSPLQQNGEAVIPSISIAGAVVLAVCVALLLLAYINHIARSMQVTQIIRRVTDETLEAIDQLSPHQEGESDEEAWHPQVPDEPGYVIRTAQRGWVQQARPAALLSLVPAGTLLRLDAQVGAFVAEGVPLCTLWPKPEHAETVEKLIRLSVALGAERTMQEDLAFGIRQLSDIALRALSPGVNDPTTAYEAIVHLGVILRALFWRALPPRVLTGKEGRRLLRPDALLRVDYVNLAFDQIRLAGTNQPAIALALLEVLGMLLKEAREIGDEALVAVLQKQARLTVAGCAASSPLPADLERVRIAASEAGFSPGAGA